MLELSKRYEPSSVEDKITTKWLDENIFHADPKSKKEPFTIVIPPPNVTGILHIGHALNNTLQDIIIRYKRMDNFNALWVPGSDHAGIATQNVVEKKLAKEGKSKEEIGRAAFEKEVWDWKELYGRTIISQLKKLGASADWDRERFTMDDGLSKAVRKVFVTLYNEGLIYKGEYIINWCPRCLTALSDIEVEHQEKDSFMWHISYQVKGYDDEFIIATTRPETLLGDSAVCVHPNDSRYQKLIGKKAILPIANREIPIIADEYVDMEFGSGALKVTPSHDLNDFLLGRKHSLEFINIFDQSATVNSNGLHYEGLSREEARTKIIAELETEGKLVKTEPYRHSVGTCYRCQTIIEPAISTQWFVKAKPLAEPAIKAVKDGDIKILPANWANLYFDWMGNIKDWCISRQLWWGHQIPAWSCSDCTHITVAELPPSRCEKCSSLNIKQDEDVLDTWFSSALWPFSTLGWPDKTDEMKTFYPTSTLITSFDIIFFWVARMIMMGIHFTGKPPFKTVYIHALIRDAAGAKMSKSLGNTIDPIDTIKEYGTDSLRITLAALVAQGRDIKLNKERIEGYRNFCNKIWNASRFALMNLDKFEFDKVSIDRSDLELFDRWIISRLNQTIKETRAALDSYRFNDAVAILYQFTWRELCDWYLEVIKPRLFGTEDGGEAAKHTLVFTIETILRALHPFIPFITEELWSHFKPSGTFVALANYPEVDQSKIDTDIEDAVAIIIEITTAIRNVKAELQINPGTVVEVQISKESDPARLAMLEAHTPFINKLASARLKFIETRNDKPKDAVIAIATSLELFINLQGLVEIDKWHKKLEKSLIKVDKNIAGLKMKLADEKFLKNAPESIVQKTKDELALANIKLERLKANLE
ncbi:MAG: valine--tRNA ligase [Nitrospinota bacterium]